MKEIYHKASKTLDVLKPPQVDIEVKTCLLFHDQEKASKSHERELF